MRSSSHSTSKGQTRILPSRSKPSLLTLPALMIRWLLPNRRAVTFLATSNLLETHADSSYLGGLSQANIQMFFVTVAYKLNKVGDGSEMSSVSFKAQDKGSEQNAIGFTMNKVAGKVSGEISKAAAAQ